VLKQKLTKTDKATRWRLHGITEGSKPDWSTAISNRQLTWHRREKKNIYMTERYVGVANGDNIDGVILDVTSRKRIKKAN
jgi:hypothetical protein